MTLNDIIKNLLKNNYKRYIILIFSVCFSILMIGIFGTLLFSPTVTSVLIAGGSTYIFALGMFFITILGISIFLIYSNGIFFKYKSNEIGILLSLGMNRKKVFQMTKKEFSLIFLIGSGVGVVLIIPVAWLFWTIISLFFTSYETTFKIGWQGIWISIIFIILMWFILLFINYYTIKKLDIIKILKSSTTVEEIKGDNFILGLLGFISIPFSIIMFSVGGSNISIIFLVMSIVGLYLFTIQITLIGNVFKKFTPKIYYKQLLFFNLMKQKGKQYTFSLFISTILIAICIFSICFNSSVFIDLYFQIKEEPFDCSLLVNNKSFSINSDSIHKMVSDNGANVKDLEKITMILVGRKYTYSNYFTEWSYDFLINENDANKFLKDKLSVPLGTCIPFDDSGMSKNFSTFYGTECVFYNPTTKEDFIFTLGKGITGNHIINRTKSITRFVIVNNLDFDKIYSSIEKDYIYQYYLFNIDNLQNATKFNKELVERIISENNGIIHENQFDSVVKDKYFLENKDFEDKYILYKGNELYVARRWDCYPFIRNTAIANSLEEYAVYMILLFFIAVVAFVCSSMIIGIKIMSTLWQDKTEYKKASFLGLSNNELSKLITKQISLIYLFPSFFGCAIGIFIVYNIMMVSSVKNINIIIFIAIVLSLCILLIQAIIFYFIRKSILHQQI